tara:strand:+ start:399 stop:1145 length:747 start_codon:yes stop_codon:yes gene_type:complete
MPVWYNCGNGYIETTFARVNNDAAAFICCSGPSLSLVNPKHLNGHNRVVLGLNNSYPFITPDIWIGMDEPDGYPDDIYDQPFVKIMRAHHQDAASRGREINQKWNMFYASVKTPVSQDAIFNLKKNSVDFVWNNNGFATALHIALWMGFKKIYLFGCDLDNSKKDYHNDILLSDKQKSYSQRLYGELFEWLKWFASECPNNNIKLYSCSRGSKINDFLTYIDYHDAIKECDNKTNLNSEIKRHPEATE